jgi:hypothetical protein
MEHSSFEAKPMQRINGGGGIVGSRRGDRVAGLEYYLTGREAIEVPDGSIGNMYKRVE